MFGIDLGRVGVMTSARTIPRQTFPPCDDDGASTSNTGRGGRGAASNISAGDTDGIGRRTAEKEERGLNIPTRKDTATEVAAKRKKLLSEKLKLLDTLLSDELPSSPVAGSNETKENEEDARGHKGLDDPAIVVREKEGLGTPPPAHVVADLGGGADTRSQPCKDDSLVKEVPSGKARGTTSGGGCDEVLAAEPLQAGHGRIEKEAEKLGQASGDEKVGPKGVSSAKQRHVSEKALPNHRYEGQSLFMCQHTPIPVRRE